MTTSIPDNSAASNIVTSIIFTLAVVLENVVHAIVSKNQ